MPHLPSLRKRAGTLSSVVHARRGYAQTDPTTMTRDGALKLIQGGPEGVKMRITAALSWRQHPELDHDYAKVDEVLLGALEFVALLGG